METSSTPPETGLTRRDALRRGATLGGALVWTVPVVQSISGSALAAQGSEVAVEGTKSGRGQNGGGTDDGVQVLGSTLPGTGSTAGDLAVLGVGAVAVGAALRSVRKKPPAAEGAGDASPEG